MSFPSVTGVVPRAARDNVSFLGADRDYWRLMLRGALLLMFTLGIYRFWLVTDMRRFQWSNTEVGGDSLEYTGTAFEILIGFLIAIALLVPIYSGFFFAALDLGPLGRIAGVLSFVLLAFLGQFAVYRARRYRLTRTVYRGIRFRQTGSAWRYAVCAMFWWAMIIVTLGLAFPVAQARLERFKMNNTYYGDLAGEFHGEARTLFWRGAPLWLLVVGPMIAGIAYGALRIDWGAAIAAATQDGDDVFARIEGASPGFGAGVVIAILGCIWAVLAAMAVYPAFQALVLRWWLAGLRFGPVTTVSRVRTGQIYGIYMRLLGYSVLFSISAGIAGSLATGIYALLAPIMPPLLGEILVTAGLLVSYVVAALAYSTIYQVIVKLGFWRVGANSLELSGTAALDRVKAVGHPSSSIGEGLANALGVGGW
jgi:uncharacterized membrane protein YjgN (DUF898 family)